jgi:hypothetical protein
MNLSLSPLHHFVPHDFLNPPVSHGSSRIRICLNSIGEPSLSRHK